MSVTYVTRPRTTDLTTLAAVKLRLGITVTTFDARLQADIEAVSSLIALECNREFALAVVRESLPGDDSSTIVLKRRPVLAVEGVNDLDVAVDASAYLLQDGDAGLLYREGAGWWTEAGGVDPISRDPSPMRGRNRYSITYRGGYRLAPDNVLSSGVAVAAAGRTLTLASSDDRAPWPLLASGEQVRLRGFVGAGNNGWKTVVSRTDTVLGLAEALTNETAPAGSVIETATAPPALERLAIEAIRTWHLDRTRSANLRSQSIGDWSETYAAGADATVLPAGVCAELRRLFGAWV